MPGTIAIPEAVHLFPDTGFDELDRGIEAMAEAKLRWGASPIKVRAAMARQAMADTLAVSEEWVKAACAAKGVGFNRPAAGEEWQGGPALLIRNLRLLAATLDSIEEKGHPSVGKVATRDDGTVVVDVFPTDNYDRALFAGVKGQVWMKPGVTKETLSDHMAGAYRDERPATLCLVLGAGNIASIPAMDALYKLYAENSVVILKMNPVNAYLGPIYEKALRVFVDAGFLAIVHGGAEVGEYLVFHDGVEHIHITGSDKAHNSIVFGSGPDGATRRRDNDPRLNKPITSELGNVTPVIVVPGAWSRGDLRFQGENIASGLTHNAGFNCIANRVVITHESWDQRQDLVKAVGSALDRIPTRPAYYPGAASRRQAYLAEYGDSVVEHGDPHGDALPWTLVTGLAPDDPSGMCFQTECFTGLFAETALPAPSVVEYLAKAVEFCNDALWGTLGVTILVDPKSMKDPAVAAAVDKAIVDLRYGTVAINVWSAVTYAMVTTPWGAYPGHPLDAIGSGRGVVHNSLMLDDTLKSVARAPFRQFPKPVWFGTNRSAHKTLRALTELEADPSPGKLLKTASLAAMG